MDRYRTKDLEWNGCDAAYTTPGHDSTGWVQPNYHSSSSWVQPYYHNSSSWVQPNYHSSSSCVQPDYLSSRSSDWEQPRNYCSSSGWVRPNYLDGRGNGWEEEKTDFGRTFSCIRVEGYDTSLREYDLKLALIKHFSSCGVIVHIYVPRDFERDTLKSFAFIHIVGEGAEEKVLGLSGSDVGGWNVFASSIPYDGQYNDPGWAIVNSSRFRIPNHMMIVTGYDTSLPEIDIKIGLCNHFSSCGEVTGIRILGGSNDRRGRNALVYILGEDALEKAMELVGGCDGGAWNIAVALAMPPPGAMIGYDPSSSFSLPIKSNCKMTKRTKKNKSTME